MSTPLNFNHAAMNRRVEDAHRLFQWTLASWAGDVLELRRRNLLVPRWEQTPTEEPAYGVYQGDWPDEPMKRAA
jgi:hypothetical protein